MLFWWTLIRNPTVLIDKNLNDHRQWRNSWQTGMEKFTHKQKCQAHDWKVSINSTVGPSLWHCTILSYCWYFYGATLFCKNTTTESDSRITSVTTSVKWTWDSDTSLFNLCFYLMPHPKKLCLRYKYCRCCTIYQTRARKEKTLCSMNTLYREEKWHNGATVHFARFSVPH